MSGEPDNIILVYLRRIDAKLDRLIDNVRDLKHRRSPRSRARLPGCARKRRASAAIWAAASLRIDRIETRLDRIERRLDLVPSTTT